MAYTTVAQVTKKASCVRVVLSTSKERTDFTNNVMTTQSFCFYFSYNKYLSSHLSVLLLVYIWKFTLYRPSHLHVPIPKPCALTQSCSPFAVLMTCTLLRMLYIRFWGVAIGISDLATRNLSLMSGAEAWCTVAIHLKVFSRVEVRALCTTLKFFPINLGKLYLFKHCFVQTGIIMLNSMLFI